MPNAYNFGTFQLIEGDVNYRKNIFNPISRRSFMKLMGLAAMGTVLSSGTETVQAAAPPAPSLDFDEVE